MTTPRSRDSAVRWPLYVLVALVLAGVIGLLLVSSGISGDSGDSGGSDDAGSSGEGDGATDSPSSEPDSPSAPADDGAALPADDPGAEGPAPLALLAVQGPVADEARYVSVTWSLVDLDRRPDQPSSVVAYEVERDGEVVAEVAADDEERWNDAAYRDDDVEPGMHRYRVRAVYAQGRGPWSAPAPIEVRSEADIGPVFEVDGYDGSDRERAQAAVDEAAEAGGGVVRFAARTYVFDEALIVQGNGVLLQGAGREETVIRPGFDGAPESCGPVDALVLFTARSEPLEATVAADTPRGSRTITFDRDPGVEIGDFIEVDGVEGQMALEDYAEMGVATDPSTGTDERYPFDAGRVVAVDGDTVTIDHALSPIITAGAKLHRWPSGQDNGIELLTVEGAGPDDASYYRLIDVTNQIDFRLADVTGRWANRNVFDASGNGITLIGLDATQEGPAAYEPEPCKYKVGFGPTTDVVLVDSRVGRTDDDRNMSLVTLQFAYRAVVRNNVLGQSRTYSINEHGGGSRDLVIENNWIGAGPQGWSGVLLGNDTWGFGGETAIRNNAFVNNVVDVLMVENPYGVVVAGNRSEGCLQACVTWSGWSGDERSGIPDPADYGSARLTVIGNRFVSNGDGLDLGVDESYGHPYLGIRDAVVAGNVIDAADRSVVVEGDASTSGRLWITDNALTGPMAVPEPGADWWLFDNTEGPTTGSDSEADSRPDSEADSRPDWSGLHQPWELEEGR